MDKDYFLGYLDAVHDAQKEAAKVPEQEAVRKGLLAPKHLLWQMPLTMTTGGLGASTIRYTPFPGGKIMPLKLRKILAPAYLASVGGMPLWLRLIHKKRYGRWPNIKKK